MRIAVAGGTGVCGSYVVAAARAAGHDVSILSRANGIDLLVDTGLYDALRDVEVIVDATNPATTNGSKASAFFEDVTGRLQRIGARAGVGRLVTLSIVGIDRASGFGYYAAKLRQERAAQLGPVRSTVVRATQFFEFPAQVVARTKVGAVALVPVMRSQPIAARSLGHVLVGIATAPPGDGMIEVAGPRQEDVVSMARRVIKHRGRRIRVVPARLPGVYGRAFRGGALLPSASATLAGPTFDAWLTTEDSASPSF